MDTTVGALSRLIDLLISNAAFHCRRTAGAGIPEASTIIAASSLSGSRPRLMDYATSEDCHLNITRAFAAFLME